MNDDEKPDKGSQLGPEDVTPESLYLNRRNFLRTSIFGASAAATYAAYRYVRGEKPNLSAATDQNLPIQASEDRSTPIEAIAGYNNFYEFSTDKEEVAEKARNWNPGPWKIHVDGLVEQPQTFDLIKLSALQQEERIYRFRCVEGWSMVIPWLGFPLARLIEQAKPLSSAKYVAFESYFDEQAMPDARRAGIPFPYVEGLRLDEALHPLTLMATGLYKKALPNQNGAPIRLVVPWKYGFKSIKSIVRISLTDQEPPTTWNLATPSEYGFYSNVNPTVDHPRWSQAQERRIGEFGLRPTLMFNGYEKEVSHLYAGMDLRKFF